MVQSVGVHHRSHVEDGLQESVLFPLCWFQESNPELRIWPHASQLLTESFKTHLPQGFQSLWPTSNEEASWHMEVGTRLCLILVLF